MRYEGISVYTGQRLALETRDGLISNLVHLPGANREENPVFLSRGFTDIQVNGYQGVDYSGADLSAEGILRLIHDLALEGTYQHLPTLITGGHEQTAKNLALIAELAEADPAVKAAIPGIHLEGPYLSSEEGARGAHPLPFIRNPDIRELEAWQKAARGLIRLITLAPERPNAVDFIKEATQLGIRVALGHTLLDEETLHQAIQAGAGLSTHLGNGSPALLPRLSNHIWAQLAEDRLSASLIADGFHLPLSTLKVFVRAKGLKRTILISDAGPMGGLAPGRYQWGSIPVEVGPEGRLSLAGTGYLAGAGHLLSQGLYNLMKACGLSIREALKTVDENPRAFLGLPFEPGEFAAGAPADVVCFRVGSENLEVLSGAYQGAVFGGGN